MKYRFLFSLSIFCTIGVFSQNNFYSTPDWVGKPPIDTSVLGKWQYVSDANINYDGSYVWYTIYNKPVARSLSLIVQAVNSSWNKKFPGIYNAIFTDDSKKIILKNQHDSLCFLTLGSSVIEYIPYVKAFKLFKNDNTEYILYQLKSPDNKLVLQNLSTGGEQSFVGVQEYLLHNNGNILLLSTVVLEDSAIKQLLWVDLTERKTTRIWTGNNAANLVMDEDGAQLAFTVEDKTGKSFWCYKAVTGRTEQVANHQTDGINDNFQLGSILRFNKDGNRLFIVLKEKTYSKANNDAVKVDVWSYTDVKLQSQQLGEGGSDSYTAVLNMHTSQIRQLQESNEEIGLLERDSIAIVTQTKGGAKEEWNWNAASHPTFFILNTYTGAKEQLLINYPHLSPGGMYLIGSDSPISGEVNNILSYDLVTKQYHNITRSISVPEIDKEIVMWSTLRHRSLSASAWIVNDEALLINDHYDIWLVDPLGKKEPLNVTNGYGRKHHIVFRLPFSLYKKPIANSGVLILNAFDKANKKNGFYRVVLGKNTDPELISMGSVKINDPVKARDAEVYLVNRQSVCQSSNFFCTSDFKSFHPVSDNYPEKAYNWMTSELISWKSFDGTMLQGALYKPENFDLNKKYPVIFSYYEERSDELNEYKIPGATYDEINIAWFVSNGYLVFTPDIHYTIGQPGKSSYNAVVSAAHHLAKFPWVDAKHMGIQGHSFGGYETNYIVSHTNLFAAAMSASGPSDLISGYGSVIGNGGSAQFFYETHQTRLGCTLWERPDIYIDNSPIFQADKVATPLLMMNNKNDAVVSFTQGVEFFTALRRLGKKVWMLQYDNGAHSVYPGSKEAMDYHMRLTQFFDHYLKGLPAPKWMTRGIPANKKGIDNGMELDTENKTPGKGLLMR